MLGSIPVHIEVPYQWLPSLSICAPRTESIAAGVSIQLRLNSGGQQLALQLLIHSDCCEDKQAD